MEVCMKHDTKKDELMPRESSVSGETNKNKYIEVV